MKLVRRHTIKALKLGKFYRTTNIDRKEEFSDHTLVFYKSQRLMLQTREARKASIIPMEGTTLKSQEGRLLLPKYDLIHALETVNLSGELRTENSSLVLAVWQFLLRAVL